MENIRKKINIIDLICIVVLISVILFGIFKLSDLKNITTDSTVTKISYVVEAKNQSADILDYINIEDKVFEDESLKDMGVVKDITYIPYKLQTEDSLNKRILEKEVPGKISVDIKIEADAQRTNGGMSVDSVNILVGKTIDLNVGDSYIEGVIISVEDINEKKEAQ